jgi:hypothetical protein
MTTPLEIVLEMPAGDPIIEEICPAIPEPMADTVVKTPTPPRIDEVKNLASCSQTPVNIFEEEGSTSIPDPMAYKPAAISSIFADNANRITIPIPC